LWNGLPGFVRETGLGGGRPQNKQKKIIEELFARKEVAQPLPPNNSWLHHNPRIKMSNQDPLFRGLHFTVDAGFSAADSNQIKSLIIQYGGKIDYTVGAKVRV
jgi:hypothetical protein